MQDSKRDTDVKNRLLDSVGEGKRVSLFIIGKYGHKLWVFEYEMEALGVVPDFCIEA